MLRCRIRVVFLLVQARAACVPLQKKWRNFDASCWHIHELKDKRFPSAPQTCSKAAIVDISPCVYILVYLAFFKVLGDVCMLFRDEFLRLEDLQSSMMETIRSEFRGCLKEAGDKIGQGDSASLTSLASGITSQIHHLRDVETSVQTPEASRGLRI